MLPEPDPGTGCLPPGVHDAGWADIVARFAGNSHRAPLTEGLLAACRNLATAGCREPLLDGSLVSTKAVPRDYDAAREMAGVDPDRLDSIFLDFGGGRAATKAKYPGDPFPASALAAPEALHRDFFRTGRNGVGADISPIGLGNPP